MSLWCTRRRPDHGPLGPEEEVRQPLSEAFPGVDLLTSFRACVAGCVIVVSASVAAAGVAWPQTVTPPALGVHEQGQPPAVPQVEPPPQVSPTPAENPGLFNEMGKLFGKLLPPLKTPSETIDDLNSRAKDAAKDAGESLSRLARPSSMVSGRTVCPIAANGTPDCKAAADKLCQSKGYKEGKSLNTDSAETCSPKVMIPGRTRKPDDCRTDNYITSALCQ